MKTSTTLLAAALVSAFTATTANAGTRMLTNGRAGYTVIRENPSQNNGRTPRASGTRLQTAGRSGYVIISVH